MSAELKPLPTPEEREEAVLRLRLGWHREVYVARLPGKHAALRMRARGEVLLREGQGRDEGLLILEATTRLGRPIDRDGVA